MPEPIQSQPFVSTYCYEDASSQMSVCAAPGGAAPTADKATEGRPMPQFAADTGSAGASALLAQFEVNTGGGTGASNLGTDLPNGGVPDWAKDAVISGTCAVAGAAVGTLIEPGLGTVVGSAVAVSLCKSALE